MSKRITSRGIIIDGEYFYALFRRKKLPSGEVKEYYAVPGGGVEDGESLEETLIRELKEEFTIDVKIKGYLGKEEDENSIHHYFSTEIISGTPILGGEELERNNKNNYYEIRKLNIKDIDNINILPKDKILKAYKNEYETIKK